jgi:hypothetical protein
LAKFAKKMFQRIQHRYQSSARWNVLSHCWLLSRKLFHKQKLFWGELPKYLFYSKTLAEIRKNPLGVI